MAQSSIGGFAIGISPIGGGGSGGSGGNGISSTTRSWRQIVLDADPDWLRLSLRPWVYEFSNGRKFYQPADPYQVDYVRDDLTGEIVTDDDTSIPIAPGP